MQRPLLAFKSGPCPKATLSYRHFHSFDEYLTNRRHFHAFPCMSLQNALERNSHRQNACLEGGYPAWIRTMNNASKGRCVTVTPRGIPKGDFRLAILDQTAIGKMPGETCIRIKNNPESFRGSVTVTPRNTRICDFRLAVFDSSAMCKIKCDCASAKQLAEKIKVE